MEPFVNSNNRGFTLVEVLVAFVILTIGLLGLLQVINVAINQTLATQLRNEAVLIADDFMMRERSKIFENISCSECPGTPAKYLINRNMKLVLKNYSVTKTVTELTTGDDGSAKSKEIALNISWKHKAQRYQHSLSTIISK